ncbi:MAG: DUF4270 domain-containing protein [Flavobacteriales bacterium]|nr:DUF4270 domain-containing protein [Flavobacteriales bacterium]
MKISWRITSLFLQRSIVPLCVILTLVFSQGCKDEDRSLGLNLRADGGNIDALILDSFDIITRTIREDSLRTDSLSLNVLGAINDPLTGLRKAGICLDFALPEINIDFGSTPEPDSVVLTLLFDKNSEHYGEFQTLQRFEVRRMEERIYGSDQYYSTYIPNTGALLADVETHFNFSDTVTWLENGVKKSAVGALRIKLSKEFGTELTSPSNRGNYSSNESFRNFFKGLALLPKTDHLSPGEGGIAAIDLLNANSKMLIYYNDTLSKEFLINSTCARIGSYESDYPANISSQFDQGGTHYPETYIQSLGGLKTKIEIKGLYDLVADGNPVFINEAKLTIRVKKSTLTEDYPAPDRLLLLQPGSEDSSNTFILDLIDEIAPINPLWIGNTNYGGSYDSKTSTYTFRINRHLQKLLDDFLAQGTVNNRGFYLIIPSDRPVTASRVVLENGELGMRGGIELKVTYIKL